MIKYNVFVAGCVVSIECVFVLVYSVPFLETSQTVQLFVWLPYGKDFAFLVALFFLLYNAPATIYSSTKKKRKLHCNETNESAEYIFCEFIYSESTPLYVELDGKKGHFYFNKKFPIKYRIRLLRGERINRM